MTDTSKNSGKGPAHDNLSGDPQKQPQPRASPDLPTPLPLQSDRIHRESAASGSQSQDDTQPLSLFTLKSERIQQEPATTAMPQAGTSRQSDTPPWQRDGQGHWYIVLPFADLQASLRFVVALANEAGAWCQPLRLVHDADASVRVSLPSTETAPSGEEERLAAAITRLPKPGLLRPDSRSQD